MSKEKKVLPFKKGKSTSGETTNIAESVIAVGGKEIPAPVKKVSSLDETPIIDPGVAAARAANIVQPPPPGQPDQPDQPHQPQQPIVDVVTLTISGLLLERDADGTRRIIKQEFNAPIPRNLPTPSPVADAVWSQIHKVGGLSIEEPGTRKFHYYPLASFEKLVLEVGAVTGALL